MADARRPAVGAAPTLAMRSMGNAEWLLATFRIARLPAMSDGERRVS